MLNVFKIIIIIIMHNFIIIIIIIIIIKDSKLMVYSLSAWDIILYYNVKCF